MSKVTTHPSPMYSFDAEVWADSFIAHTQADSKIPTDKGTMLAWFASALMRGSDEATRKRDSSLERIADALERIATTLEESNKLPPIFWTEQKDKQ